jgi:ribosomal protein L37AE/L43A
MECPVCENSNMREHISHFKCGKCGTVMNKTTPAPRNLRKQEVQSLYDQTFHFLYLLWRFVVFRIAYKIVGE